MCKCKNNCNCNTTSITKGEKGDSGAIGATGADGATGAQGEMINGWKLNGNIEGSEKYFGTNDNFDIPIYTNGVSRGVFDKEGNFGFGISSSVGARVDIKGNATDTLFKINNSNFLFCDKIRIDNNGSFFSTSDNTNFAGTGSSGIGNFITGHLNYQFQTSYSTYLAFTNAGGASNKSSYGIIGSTIANADSDYKLVILNNDAGAIGSVLKVVSTASSVVNDGFDYNTYGLNVVSDGVFNNAGVGIFYKTGINLNITNGNINRAVNIENGLIRVVKANQPLYATLTTGDFYYDTAANILSNGDFVVGMKA